MRSGSNFNKKYFSERNIVSFPERYSKSEKGRGFDILCMRSAGVRGICANAPLLHRTDLLSCQSLAVFFQVRFGTEPVVKEKGRINLNCLHMYQLLQSTRFEM